MRWLTYNCYGVAIPILPHFASECLSQIKVKDFNWPEYYISMLKEDIINIVIQINGKKRALIKIKPDFTDNRGTISDIFFRFF